MLMSSRPMVISRGRSFGSTSKTVRRPSGSRLVVTTPPGLWNRNSRVRSIGGISTPSSSILSDVLTLKAGEVSLTPLTFTLPSAISASASRREAMPARASRLAMRSLSAAPSSSERRGPAGRTERVANGLPSRRGGRGALPSVRARGGPSYSRRAGRGSAPERSRFTNGLSPSGRSRFTKLRAGRSPKLRCSPSARLTNGSLAPPPLKPPGLSAPDALKSRCGRSPATSSPRFTNGFLPGA